MKQQVSTGTAIAVIVVVLLIAAGVVLYFMKHSGGGGTHIQLNPKSLGLAPQADVIAPYTVV